MQYISFAWTTPALLAGRKTVTRREWKDRHASRFHKGDLVTAYDKNPRFGGRPVATIQLTADPVKEMSNEVRIRDWEDEGFVYLVENSHLLNGKTPMGVWRDWILDPRPLYVVRFQLDGPPK